MDRINRIISHPKYSDYLSQIKTCELNRIFCKHDMAHFLDVARIAYAFSLENPQPQVTKEDIYAVALLHDIGRFLEYQTGERHELASKRLCKDILQDSGYNEAEIWAYQTAIGNHRNVAIKNDMTLSGLLYRGDKASRPCHSCPVEKDCNWDCHKKNLLLTI